MQTVPDCRCRGTGAYTVEISLADAVVTDQRLCVEHGLHPRARVYDIAKCQVGEVMEITDNSVSVWLRPPNGGREWKTTVESLRPPKGAS